MAVSRPRLSRHGRAVPAALAVLLAAGLVTVPSAGSEAKPPPDPAKLRAKIAKLANRAEQVTEQYNGKKLALARARHAAATARRTANSEKRAYNAARKRVGALAAARYVTGGEPDVTMITERDPQRWLDASALGQHLSDRDTALLRDLKTTRDRYGAARRRADNRVRDAKRVTDDLGKKKRDINRLVRSLKDKLPDRPPSSGDQTPPAVAGSGKAARAVKAALAVLGTPYSWGGGTAAGPSYGVAQGANIKGFDCSGLTLYAYAKVGITLPHYTGAQYQQGRHVSESELKPGDLVFFYSDLHHMGMYIGGGKMVHAPHTGDVVRIAPMTGRPFAGAVRLVG